MSFEAKFQGRCGDCDGEIRPGDEVRYTYPDRELVHDRCPIESGSTDVCPACWTIHAGECA
ncbi:hypothetical protein [Mycobacteroides abscessus]|uniref:Uncharacterized protein n=1 Tax=Mycobacteroides abscessus subsp. massiliense TaxID=1962118 RepID=A0A1T7FNL0_9MYCO|nr:hypothetical protein [Mycobacteroides abscessus]QST89833.1 hypothetical protein PROPHIGD53-3_30 [Mycobacterium phage prophiGD53-3]AMU27680.1 hypothetical protein A3N96_21625 [Mycobacteroides abscessus]EIV58070.1 hypothetical protein MA3A0930S_0146 [Mycobacteroides abscessus 3A-0930-S]EIV62204.1 hypothetical protein MA3A0930R_0146 [Mycobacteroides abscessus 3A-0930-R]EIV84529.1 hypothetical protein MM3A0810R_0145 [Mycobacteroides abscessus 3A-0810-R]